MYELSNYYRRDHIDRAISRGDHRAVIGGKWEEIGRLQFNHLKQAGLMPANRLLDIGCGSLRAGVHFAAYLDAGNYFGIDLHDELIDAGYNEELRPLGLDVKVPRSNFHSSEDFDFNWVKTPFDFAIAQSVFTHLPLNHLKLALANLKPAMADHGVFFATFFIVPDDHKQGTPFRHPAGVTSKPAHDPFHYVTEEIQLAARLGGWRLVDIRDWGHPRDQMIAEFRLN